MLEAYITIAAFNDELEKIAQNNPSLIASFLRSIGMIVGRGTEYAGKGIVGVGGFMGKHPIATVASLPVIAVGGPKAYEAGKRKAQIWWLRQTAPGQYYYE